MNAAQLSAWFEQNKKPVMVVAGAGAVGLGLMSARKKNATVGGEPTPGPLASSAGTAFASAPAIAGTMPYNTSGVDAYNDLQAQIIDIYAQQEAAKTPIPVPVQEGFYARAGGHGIYHVDAAGNRDWLNMPEYLAMTNNKPDSIPVTKVAKDSSFWANTKLVGEDKGTWTT